MTCFKNEYSTNLILQTSLFRHYDRSRIVHKLSSNDTTSVKKYPHS